MIKNSALMLIFLLLLSCGSKKTSISQKQIEEQDLKGNWSIASINFDGFRDYQVKLFNDGSQDCFLISDWNFVSNNNRGMYDITNNNCDTGKRYFIWSLNDQGEFILKPTDERYKSETDLGYNLKVKSVSENSMVLSQTLQIDGGPVNMEINFIKTTLR